MQASGLPWLFLSPVARKIYDQDKSHHLKLTNGDVEQAEEIAILLIFQPNGLLDSTLHTLAHLRSQGISPLVVSNAPLSENDRAKLLAYTWRIMERPNLGYDFGGYRDGILHVLEAGLRLSRLFVLNDSIWFPLGDNSDLLDQARASDADVFGFVLNTSVRAKHRHHLQSYFFSFGVRLISSADFKVFWQKLFLTNNKNLVVRRCEIPMTDTFRRRGYSIASRHTYADAAQALKSLSNDTLQSVIAYQAKVDAKSATHLQRHLTSQTLDGAWRARVVHDIDAGLFNKYFLIAHPAVLVGVLSTPLLKKDRQEIYRLQRSELINGGFDAKFTSIIREEIRNWDQE